MRGSNFSYLVKQGIVSVWHNRIMSFASFCIIMVSLLLIGLSVLVSIDLSKIIGDIESTNEILVYVYGETPESEQTRIKDILNSFNYVDKVTHRSPGEAWEMMRDSFSSDITELFDAISENPMPNTFIVTLNDITKINEAAERFREFEHVEDVKAPYDFAEFLISIRNTFTLIGSAVLLALVVVCLVIIYNTARASVFARRMQISIMKHVGATNAFIKTPFFIEGMFIGVLAGIVSWYLIKISYESVVSLFGESITILDVLGLNNILGINEITLIVLAANCLAGALLGAVGTVLGMGKHLKV